MIVSKVIPFQNNIAISQSYNEGIYTFVFCSETNKFIWKTRLAISSIYKDSSLLFLSNDLSHNDYSKIMYSVSKSLYDIFYSNYSSFGKLHMIGLGFKNFVMGRKLYILVGDCNYIIFDIPEALKVYCKKNQIYILSVSNSILYDFMANIKKVKKSNFYKGKGVLQFKNFKFTKLKIGKKQRFM